MLAGMTGESKIIALETINAFSATEALGG